MRTHRASQRKAFDGVNSSLKVQSDPIAITDILTSNIFILRKYFISHTQLLFLIFLCVVSNTKRQHTKIIHIFNKLYR